MRIQDVFGLGPGVGDGAVIGRLLGMIPAAFSNLC